MNVDAIGYLPPLGAPLPEAGADMLRASGGRDFAAWLDQTLGETNQKLIDADARVEKLALGDTENLHQVMLALEEARLSFQLMVQVRNKLLESYQDILRMQV